MAHDRLEEPAKPTIEPKYEHDEFTDKVYDADAKAWNAKISYSAYHYDNAMRICELKVSTDFHNEDGSLEDSVLEIIKLREGRRVVLETSMQII